MANPVEYRIESRLKNSRERWRDHAGPFQCEDDARLQFANAAAYPLDREYRIVKVETVFTS